MGNIIISDTKYRPEARAAARRAARLAHRPADAADTRLSCAADSGVARPRQPRVDRLSVGRGLHVSCLPPKLRAPRHGRQDRGDDRQAALPLRRRPAHAVPERVAARRRVRYERRLLWHVCRDQPCQEAVRSVARLRPARRARYLERRRCRQPSAALDVMCRTHGPPSILFICKQKSCLEYLLYYEIIIVKWIAILLNISVNPNNICLL